MIKKIESPHSTLFSPEFPFTSLPGWIWPIETDFLGASPDTLVFFASLASLRSLDLKLTMLINYNYIINGIINVNHLLCLLLHPTGAVLATADPGNVTTGRDSWNRIIKVKIEINQEFISYFWSCQYSAVVTSYLLLLGSAPVAGCELFPVFWLKHVAAVASVHRSLWSRATLGVWGAGCVLKCVNTVQIHFTSLSTLDDGTFHRMWCIWWKYWQK